MNYLEYTVDRNFSIKDSNNNIFYHRDNFEPKFS